MNKVTKRIFDPTGLHEKTLKKGMEYSEAAKAKEGTHTTTFQTDLPGEEVIVKSVQLFTTNWSWRVGSQSSNLATFIGRQRGVGKWIVAIGLIVAGIPLCLVIIGIPMIIAGVILAIRAIVLLRRFQNLTIAVRGTEVTVTYPGYAQKLVDQFLATLPKAQSPKHEPASVA